MDRPGETTGHEGQTSIFTEDVSCPQCGYNLRGIREARCPECGLEFDPEKIRAQEQGTYRRTPPSVIRGLWLMYTQPDRFWLECEARFTEGFSVWRVMFFFLLAAAPVAAVPAYLRADDINGGFVAGWLALTPVIVVGLGAVGVVHGFLCWIAWPWAASAGRPSAAAILISYSVGWMIPAVPILGGTFGIMVSEGFQGSLARQAAAAVLGVLLLLCCWRWAIGLYHGGAHVSGGRRWLGFWYAIANPFWYVAMRLLLSAA